MFGKKEEMVVPKRTSSSQQITALLGKESEFEGKLTFEGTARIDGKFEGEIFSKDTLIVGSTASVNAKIEVNIVCIYGEVRGNIHAKTKVEILSSGRLFGDIQTVKLVVEDGAHFEGSSKTIGVQKESPSMLKMPEKEEEEEQEGPKELEMV